MNSKSVCFIALWVGILIGFSSVRAMEINEWEIIINIPEYRLYLLKNSEVYQTFPVAVGKPSTPSPMGNFRIVNKVVNPIWIPKGKTPVPPGPHNPLGKYWLGLNKIGYGIHGNNAASSIGHPVSNGCFRMDNRDIETLYRLVPKGTRVKILYVTVFVKIDPNQTAWLHILPDIYKQNDLPQIVKEELDNLEWTYEPHRKALLELIQGEKQKVVEIPRMLQVAGELAYGDAFFWNDDLYLEKRNFVSDEIMINLLADQVLFKDYISMKTIEMGSPGRYQWLWRPESNVVSIRRLK